MKIKKKYKVVLTKKAKRELDYVVNPDLIKLKIKKKKKKNKTKVEDRYPVQKQNEDIDLSELRRSCANYISEVANHGYPTEYEESVFEAAITAIFGKKVWKYINKRL